MRRAGTLEMHEHSQISGPGHNISRNGRLPHINHSHQGGDKPHQHEHHGPASYTIDKDEWFAATGLRGGGRKVFTAAPTGPQLPIVELADWQKSFEVIVDEESCARFREEQGGTVTGAGVGPAARMVLGAKMIPLFPGPPSRRKANS